MYSLLILVLLFWFTTIHSKWFCKSHLFLKFYVLCERSSAVVSVAVYVAVSKCMLFFFYDFVLQLFTQRECVKVNFLKLLVLHKRTNVIASFLEHPVYSSFEMFSVLILGFLFWFVVTYTFFFINNQKFKQSPRKSLIC